MNWNNILNWKLLGGSHKFPGPDGGTCINEAAIIAAGFEYREVTSANDCPPCFSRVIATYAIKLNDSMPHDLRQELLMPFVVRLAGTADTPEIERRRADHVVVQTVKRILPIAMKVAGLHDAARQYSEVETLEQAKAAAYSTAAYSSAAAAAAYAAKAAAKAAAYSAAKAAAYSAAASADAAAAAAAAAYAAAYAYAAAAYSDAADAEREIFTIAVAILDEAINLGKQAEPIETALVTSRMAAVRSLASA